MELVHKPFAENMGRSVCDGKNVDAFVLQPGFVLLHRAAETGRVDFDKFNTLLARDDIQIALSTALAPVIGAFVKEHLAEVLVSEAE